MKEKGKGFVAEFKEFISRGSVMDLAVGVIIGGAFTAIINSLVNDMLMPLISLITGGFDFTGLNFQVGGATFNYGSFISAIISFILIALVVFLLVRGINKLRKPKEEAPKFLCPYCKMEIAQDATRCPYCTAELPAPKEAKG